MEMSKTLQQIKAYAHRKKLPIIPVAGKDISLISEPDTYYKYLIERLKIVQNRISLSALYFGSGNKEFVLAQELYKASKQNKNLKVNLILDANRATRSDDKGSSVSTLEGLLSLDNTKLTLVRLVKNSSVCGFVLRNFQKWNELASIYHSKLMIFDNDVLITGANLSSIYFEKRQDRYMLFKESKLLSDYLNNILQELPKVNGPSNFITSHNELYIRQASAYNVEDSDSFVIPLFQHKPSNITEKEDFLQFLDSVLPNNAQAHLSTGYFNPSQIVDSLRFSSILAPSERANGFFNGGGLLKYVPSLYSAIQRQYLKRHPKCQLNLYDRPGWSFHAKGIWIENQDDFSIHIIGSSNFNCRSAHRDFETQLVLITRNRDLIKKLNEERNALWSESKCVNTKTFSYLNPLHGLFSNILKTLL